MSNRTLHSGTQSESCATLYFDGGSKPNPGRASYGYLIEHQSETIQGSEFIGTSTNNRAEYAGLIAGLRRARKEGISEIHVRGDSEIIVKQVRGEYNVNVDALRELHQQARDLMDEFDSAVIEYIPREENSEADALATDARLNAGL